MSKEPINPIEAIMFLIVLLGLLILMINIKYDLNNSEYLIARTNANYYSKNKVIDCSNVDDRTNGFVKCIILGDDKPFIIECSYKNFEIGCRPIN